MPELTISLPGAAAKVTVVMPTYNRAALIARAVESVLAQDFPDFELIIIDDGSMDNTQVVLAHYQDPRIQVVRFEENRGIGASRAEGVMRARGDWVSFLDADDLWHPEKLATDLSILTEHPEIDLLFDNYRNLNHVANVDSTGFEQTASAFACLKTIELDRGVFRVEAGLAEALLTANLIGTASAITLRRSLFESVGNFNPLLSGPEDFEFIWRAALAGACFAYQTRVLVERHKGADSITSTSRSFIPRFLRALDFCEVSLMSYHREELLGPLNRARSRGWQALIHACALEGRRWDAVWAYAQSVRYGFSSRSTLYLCAALMGPQAIRQAKRVLGMREVQHLDGDPIG